MATGKCCLLKPQQVSSETEVVLKGLGDGRCCRFKVLTVTVHLVYLSGTYQLRDAHSIPMLQWTQNESVYESAKPLLSMIKSCSPFSAVSLPFYLEALRGICSQPIITALPPSWMSLTSEDPLVTPTCQNVTASGARPTPKSSWISFPCCTKDKRLLWLLYVQGSLTTSHLPLFGESLVLFIVAIIWSGRSAPVGSDRLWSSLRQRLN